MNTHKHARLTFARRLEMVKQMTLQGLDAVRAAGAHGVTAPTARKWLGRYLAGGEAALADASSRPTRSPRTIDAGKALLIVELRKRRMLQARIARSVGVSESTVSRVLARAGMSKLSDLEPSRPSCATSTRRPAICCTSTPRSSGASCGPATASQATARLGRWCGLGDAVRGHRRPRKAGVHRHASRREAGQAVLFLRNAVAYYARWASPCSGC
jgi:transposase-like protein